MHRSTTPGATQIGMLGKEWHRNAHDRYTFDFAERFHSEMILVCVRFGAEERSEMCFAVPQTSR